MKDKIDRISQKPLERTRNKSDDQKEMENIINRTRLNDPSSASVLHNTDNDMGFNNKA